MVFSKFSKLQEGLEILELEVKLMANKKKSTDKENYERRASLGVFSTLFQGLKNDREQFFENEHKKDHISLKVKKANMMVGLIRRSFSFLSCNLLNKLYTSFVRPHLEYAQAI